ncbi:carbohydrate ABC transporter permease [Micromonospora globbae]|uniref:carbohydrate ABC transporter permease n=1 Tax=Micromonospora globbae TaxID=1894969 RepID=UPI00343AE845
MRNHRPWPRALGLYALLLVLAALFLTPLVWLLVLALKGPGEMLEFPPHFLPRNPRWQNFIDAMTFENVDFLGYTRNSLILSIMYAALATISSAFVGFGLARLPAPGKKAIFALLVGTLMIPHMITLIPTYLIYSKVGLLNTYWPWVLSGLAGSSFLAFMFRQFFAGMPRELEDASIVDGCGYYRMFWRIFLPLSKPVLATSFVLSFVWTWGDWIMPAMLLNDEKSTLAVAVGSLYRDSAGNIVLHLIAAAAVLYSLPVLVLFLSLQRLFIRGIATSGLR